MSNKWEIKPTGERELTVTLPDSVELDATVTEMEPIALAEAILRWLNNVDQEGKLRSGVKRGCIINW